MREAILTVGFPLSGKTRYYNLFCKNQFKYFNVEHKTDDFIFDLNKSLQRRENIFLEARNPSVHARKSYIDLFLKNYYNLKCIWFNLNISGALYYNSFIEDQNVKKNNNAEIYLYNSIFEKPTLSEGFRKIEKVILKPEKTTFGNNKAVFVSLTDALISVKSNKMFPSDFGDYSAMNNVREIIEKYKNNGYLIILCPNNFDSHSYSEEKIKNISEKIIKEISIIPDAIYFDIKSSRSTNAFVTPNLKIIFKACSDLLIDIERSIMVGGGNIDKTTADLCGFNYYFSRDVFFDSPDFVDNFLKEKQKCH